MWIFDNEIDHISGEFENGDIIEVHDFDDYFMGYGFINVNSKIRIRMMSRRKEHPVTEELIEKRVRAAWEYRDNPAPAHRHCDEARRLSHPL